MASSDTATESPLLTFIRPRLHQNLQPLLNESSHCLPILQSTCQHILTDMDTHSSATELAQVISRDHGLTCKVLQVANSIAYSPQQTISTVPRAVSWLGHDTIRTLVAAAHLVEQLQHWPIRHREFQALISKSLIAATYANELGMALEYPQPGQLFTATLLYSIGDLAIAYQDPNLFEALQAISRKVKEPKARILEETRLIGIPRLTLAQALAQMWKLPEDLIELFRHDEELPLRRWTGGFPTYRGIVVGSIQLIEAMTDTATADSIEDARRTLVRGSGLSSGLFANLMTRAMDRGRQLIHSMGLTLDYSEGVLGTPAEPDTADPIPIHHPTVKTVPTHHAVPATQDRSAVPIRSKPFETLQAFQVSLQNANDLNDLLRTFVYALHQDGGFDRVGLALLNKHDSDLLVGRLALGVTPLAPHLGSISGSLSREHQFFLTILKRADPLLVQDFSEQSAGGIKRDFIEIWKPTSAILAPLRIGVRPIGLTYCDRAASGQPVLPQDLQALQLFFAQMTLSLNRLAGIL